jgi:hypothetical protein
LRGGGKKSVGRMKEDFDNFGEKEKLKSLS